MKVTMADVRASGMCAKGARRFFARHGWDWSDFLANGMEEEQALSTGDAMAERVVEAARGRQQQQKANRRV